MFLFSCTISSGFPFIRNIQMRRYHLKTYCTKENYSKVRTWRALSLIESAWSIIRLRWAKAVMPPVKLFYVWPFLGLLSSFVFFVKRLKWNFGTSEPASNNKRTKQRFVNLLSAVTCVNVTRDENPQKGNEMGSPSFEGSQARLDWSPVSLQAHVRQ